MGLIQEILGNLKQATANALELIKKTLPTIAGAAAAGTCHCQSALELGIWSDRARIPADVRQRLHVLLGKYL
jgi:5'-methylthioadenosine phosphorylase